MRMDNHSLTALNDEGTGGVNLEMLPEPREALYQGPHDRPRNSFGAEPPHRILKDVQPETSGTCEHYHAEGSLEGICDALRDPEVDGNAVVQALGPCTRWRGQ